MTVEPAGDALGPLDGAGDAERPAAVWWFDATGLEVRWRVGAGEAPSAAASWALVWDLDADASTAELALAVHADAKVALWRPAGEAGGLHPGAWALAGEVSEATAELELGVSGGEVRLKLPDAQVVGLLGLSSTQRFRAAAVTSEDLTGEAYADVFGCDGACDDPAAVWGESLQRDADGDGLSFTQELRWGTDPDDPDTDAGGRPDGVEDADQDGQVGPWETDPRDPSDDVDSDGDGVPDLLDARVGAADDEDSDADGLPDALEGLVDTDADGEPDFADLDSDADGLLDALEGVADPDEDGIPAFRDLDSDGDGLLDAEEGSGDADGDGTPDFLDVDSDDDGRPDSEELRADSDCDAVPDRLEPDATDGPCGQSAFDTSGFDTARGPQGPFERPETGRCATVPPPGWGAGFFPLLAWIGARRRRSGGPR